MSGFSAAWLNMREPLDAESRAESLVQVYERCRWAPEDRALPIVDLGCGTGSNLRYLAPRIGGRQDWQLVDQDRELLGRVAASSGAWASVAQSVVESTESGFLIRNPGFECAATLVRMELASELDRLRIPERALVCGSALLDLVSDHWLTALARRCSDARAMVWFALTYDGRMSCEPQEAGDELVRDLVNRHQRGDKGFGPALGPSASTRVVRVFEELGYFTRSEPSDWRIGVRWGQLQRELVQGWYTAALEIDPARAPELREWRDRRLAHVDAGRSRMVVGHADFIAWPG